MAIQIYAGPDQDKGFTIRSAEYRDVGAIYALVDHYARQENSGSTFVLPVPEPTIRKHMDNGMSSVAEADGQIVAYFFLRHLGHTDAELRAYTVGESLQGRGIGSSMLMEAQQLAASAGYKRLFSYAKNDRIFKKFGFDDVTATPEKLESDCYSCKFYNNGCEEKPLVYEIGWNDALNISGIPPAA